MFDIVMPLYNKEAFVGATIDAILAQSFGDWRLFVVDDGSTDGGSALVQGYADPRIMLIRQANLGVGPARNAGIAAGRAQWIAFCDADDVWNADHLRELGALRTQFPEAALIGCAFRRFSGAAVPTIRSPGDPLRRLARYFRECAQGRELLLTSSAAVRRSAIVEVGGFERLPGNEDVELWARLALYAPVAVSSRATVNYRVDTGGISERGMGGRKAPDKPTRREELSSAIPTLDRALDWVTDPALRDDIIAYTDSRIGIRLTAAVLERDIAYARKLRPLYRAKPLGKARVAAAIARLPAPLARWSVAAATRLRRMLRR